jgi:dihydroflavonol-4-reductase
VKALVLGATGFLGSNLVRALLAHGQQVRALVRPTGNTRTLDGLDVERAVGDLRDPDSLARACAGVQVIYQTASYYPPQTIPAHAATTQALLETQNLLTAARRAAVARLVFTSTLTTIGFPANGGPATEACLPDGQGGHGEPGSGRSANGAPCGGRQSDRLFRSL